jgi:photosystem II stability/assembly factor-like uncharacterized protein
MIRLLLPLLIALAVAAGLSPRFDSWQVIGPGGAGGMFLPTISPHDPNVVLEHCDMTGAYITLDAGRSWRMFNLRGTVSAFAFDPRDRNVLYTGNHAVWQSIDAGRTWRMVLPNPARNTVEHMRDDHAAPLLTTDDPAYPGSRVRFMAVDPADSNNVCALFGGQGGRGAAWLTVSRDRGHNWARLRQFPGQAMRTMYFDGTLRLVSESGVFALHSGEWEETPGPQGVAIQSASGGLGLLYATSAAGIHMSEDGGKTWRTADNPLPGTPRFLNIACSALHARTAYVAFTEQRAGEGNVFGIAKTVDGGRRWAPVCEESRKPASNVERAWIEDFYGGTGPVRDLGVAPNNPDVCYATDSCPRSFRTLDGGKSWQQVISRRVAGDRWTTTGFDVTTCYGVHFDPFDPKNVFISYTDVGLFKSADSGETWKSSIAGIPRRWQNTTYWMEFDPKVKGMVWGAFARTHDLPRPKMWQRQEPDNYQGGVGTSTDGGEHWTVTNTGMPETAVTHIIMDPASPAGSRTLYACGFGRGVYKSRDNGKTWELKIAGIEKRQPFAWRITRATNGTLYLIVSRRNEVGYKGDAEDGALYRSADGGEHWVKMKLPEGLNGPTGLTLDPQDNRRMYLSAWGAQLADAGSAVVPAGCRVPGVCGGGVYLSTDSGESWRRIFDASQHVYDVTVDARNPNIVYNCGFETGAWRSTDRGATWARIRGFNFKWGHRVIPDPAEAARIYITTFGGSVWHGPASGDPRAVEDIITPVPTAP